MVIPIVLFWHIIGLVAALKRDIYGLLVYGALVALEFTIVFVAVIPFMDSLSTPCYSNNRKFWAIAYIVSQLWIIFVACLIMNFSWAHEEHALVRSPTPHPVRRQRQTTKRVRYRNKFQPTLSPIISSPDLSHILDANSPLSLHSTTQAETSF